MTFSDPLSALAPRATEGKFGAARTFAAICHMLLLVITLMLAGCGDIVWFPPYVRLGTTPDQFTFAPKTGTDKGVTVTSEAITVSGLTVDSPISVTGPTGSESAYSINGATATSAAGTVKNGDKVTVSHKSSDRLGATTESTLTIGTVSAKFFSTTKNIEFSAPVAAGLYRRAQGTFTTEGTAVVTHTISIKDVPNSGNAQFAISDTDTVPPDSDFRSVPLTTLLNNRRIFVRNLISNVTAGAVTTLTIDGVDIVVNLTP